MTTPLRLVLLSLLLLPLAAPAQQQAAQETQPTIASVEKAEQPEEIVVTGILPGPPLWKVYNGEHTLWIFATLSPIPDHMEWQSDRVEKVIANAQEYLTLPQIDASISPWVKYNPINLVRGMALANRLSKNPGKKALAEVLPLALYQRYTALKQKYFPRDNDFEDMRPLRAGSQMAQEIMKKEDLASNTGIMKRISKLVGKNRKIKTTEIEITFKLEGGYSTLAERVEKMLNSISGTQENACFEWQVARMESDLEAMKSRANSWAQGRIDEFRGVKLSRGEEDPCFNLLLASSEGETIADVLGRQQQLWLDSAAKALATNDSTFAVLPIRELLGTNGLLAKLQARGFEVQVPH